MNPQTNERRDRFTRLGGRLQRLISGSIIDALPRILSCVLTLVVVLSILRIALGGQRFLLSASDRELAQLTQSADPDSPEPAREDGVRHAADALGNTMGYKLTESAHFSFGHIVTADGRTVYSLGGDQNRHDPFYNLVKGDEQDANRLRMLPALYRERLLRAYNPLTGIHAGRGSNVVLTLSDRVQTAVYQYMQENGMDGICVAFSPTTGAVTCLVSNNAPRDLYRVNENLCTFRPASTFKVVLCALLEEQGVDTAALRYSCPGVYRMENGKEIRCAGGQAHGADLSTEDALGVSCNCFFAQAMEEHLDWPLAAALLERMGDIVNGAGDGARQLSGLERDASQLTLSEGEDLFSDVWSMLGEGKNNVSPLDMVQWCGAVAHGGSCARARLLQDEGAETLSFFSKQTAQAVYTQWKAAYEQHYDREKYPESITAAKTGTDQLDSNGNEAFALMGVSEALDTVFYIRIHNARTENGTNVLQKRPVDVAAVLLETMQAQQNVRGD